MPSDAHQATGSATLLAKSPRGARQLTLLQHLLETDEAARAVFKPGSRWARAFPRFFKIEGAARQARLWTHLRIAALFHDIGKANEDFQAAMRAPGFRDQSLRHEHLSALLLCEPSVFAWLAGNAELDLDVIIAAVLSHHLKAARDGDWEVLLPRHGAPTRLFFDDQQVREVFVRVAQIAQLEPFAGGFPASRYIDAAWTPAWSALFRRADQFANQLRKAPDRLRMCLAVKAGLIVCDSVSSGLWREGEDIDAWTDAVVRSPALQDEDLENDVLLPRQRELGTKWKGWHGFQTGAATVGRRGLLLAACGAGKTLAAWRWAQSVSREHEIGRVIFLYPTRGTATEGFRDYVAHAPEGEAALVHGTASYELAGMMENPPEALRGKAVVDENAARLFALGLWDKRYFSATVDQFLGFIEHGYGGLCLLPALADAAVVFDEVHSYDRRMWNALVAFLERFDVPVLCMTATLPPGRRQQLEQRCGLRSYPSALELQDLRDLEASETASRYRHSAVSREQAVDAAQEAVHAGHRVLWVVNTVRRCQQLARMLQGRVDCDVLVYHSRFKLQDRQARHRRTVDAFRAPFGADLPTIAVTTQVCEMSLDLDADVLISEHAPISSLVQRFGRANRHLRRGASFRATLLTYAPESPAPYEKKDLEAAASFLGELHGRDVSQRDLATGLERHARAEREASGSTAFLEGGYFATAGALRDDDDAGCPAILDADVALYRELEGRRAPTDGLRLTVPKRYGRAPEGEGLPGWLRIADSARYDPWLGFIVDDDALSSRKDLS